MIQFCLNLAQYVIMWYAGCRVGCFLDDWWPTKRNRQIWRLLVTVPDGGTHGYYLVCQACKVKQTLHPHPGDMRVENTISGKNSVQGHTSSQGNNMEILEPLYDSRGRGNSIMVSVSVCHAGRPGSSSVWSVCFRKVEFYQHAIVSNNADYWFTKRRPCVIMSM